jgi:hypothetical protein
MNRKLVKSLGLLYILKQYSIDVVCLGSYINFHFLSFTCILEGFLKMYKPALAVFV